jgi:hypothetical protein
MDSMVDSKGRNQSKISQKRNFWMENWEADVLPLNYSRDFKSTTYSNNTALLSILLSKSKPIQIGGIPWPPFPRGREATVHRAVHEPAQTTLLQVA